MAATFSSAVDKSVTNGSLALAGADHVVQIPGEALFHKSLHLFCHHEFSLITLPPFVSVTFMWEKRKRKSPHPLQSNDLIIIFSIVVKEGEEAIELGINFFLSDAKAHLLLMLHNGRYSSSI